MCGDAEGISSMLRFHEHHERRGINKAEVINIKDAATIIS
jgi:hypothetical protein